MKIKSFVVGPIDVNCYIVSDDTGEGVVIDPGGDADVLLSYIQEENLRIHAVLNTHGHGDHIGANDEIRHATGAPLYIHMNDASMLGDPRENLSAFMGLHTISLPADDFLQDGLLIHFGVSTLTVVHTPGHSLGGVCFVGEKVAFTGDTLFCESIGRTDFPGGSMRELVESAKNLLMTLEDDVMVFPGHGPASTVGHERKWNPYLR